MGAMAESDPPRLADMLSSSAWWPALQPPERERVLGETEERRVSGGSVVMRKGETVDAWTGEIDGLVKIISRLRRSSDTRSRLIAALRRLNV